MDLQNEKSGNKNKIYTQQQSSNNAGSNEKNKTNINKSSISNELNDFKFLLSSSENTILN